jgi:hypothetical protein
VAFGPGLADAQPITPTSVANPAQHHKTPLER